MRGRIIPALAGNTAWPLLVAALCVDHPRSRGEYAGSFVNHGRLLGSSPLSRGIQQIREESCQSGWIIPALAGNTHYRPGLRLVALDHPRSRGEYGSLVASTTSRLGSSPLSRGIHLLTRDFISWTCQILGTPSSHVSASRSHSPRVCGDRPPGGVSRLARRLKDLGGPSGLAPHNQPVPMGHPMSGRTCPAHSWHGTP